MTTETETAPPEIPEVRQCVNEGDQFGAVAVYSDTLKRWGVMTPTNGGHWADDAEVAEWPVLKAPARKATPTDS